MMLRLLKYDSTETTFPFTKVFIANQLANDYQLRVWAELAVPGQTNTASFCVNVMYLCKVFVLMQITSVAATTYVMQPRAQYPSLFERHINIKVQQAGCQVNNAKGGSL